MGSLILLIIILCLYFLPAIIASRRRHNNGGAITVLNLFLGWTLLGWIIALIWANTDNVNKNELPQEISVQNEYIPPQKKIVYKPVKKINIFYGALLGIIVGLLFGINDVHKKNKAIEQIHSEYKIVGSCSLKNAPGVLYSVYSPNLNFDEMEEFAKKQTGEENVWVFFFNKKDKTPKLKKSCENYSEKYNKNWIAGYWRYANGHEKFVKYP